MQELKRSQIFNRIKPIVIASNLALCLTFNTRIVSAATQDLYDLIDACHGDTVELSNAIEINSSASISRPNLSFTSSVNTAKDLMILGPSTIFNLKGDKYSIVRTTVYENAYAELNFNEIKYETWRSQALFHAWGSATLVINAGTFDVVNTNNNEWNANVLRTLQNGNLTLNADNVRMKSNGSYNSVAPVYAGSNGVLKIVSPDIFIESMSQKSVIAQSRDGSVPTILIDATQGRVPGKVVIKNHTHKLYRPRVEAMGVQSRSKQMKFILLTTENERESNTIRTQL